MKRLRIATLNCLNLALPGRRFYANVDPYTADEYLAKTQWLAQMLERLAADLVLVQEVFHEQALSDVVRQAGSARALSLSVPLAGIDNDKPRLGLVWRQPLQPALQSLADFPPGCAVPLPEAGTHAAFSRPLLRADVVCPQFGDAPARLFNVHLKSRRPDFVDGEDAADPSLAARAHLRSLIKRGAEAAALRRVLTEARKPAASPIVVAGDFNDGAGAVTTRIVADAAGERENETEGSFALFDALEVAAPAASGAARRAFTILEDGRPERIDLVLVSAELLPGSPGAIGRVAAVEVLGDHLIERRRDDERGAALSRIFSDHAAVCVTIEPLS